MNLPILLESPVRHGYTFFRRINADMTLDEKSLGMEWQRHDPPTLTMPLEKYLYHMTKRMGWKIRDGGDA